MINKWHIYCMKQKEKDLFLKNPALGLKASASANLNPHAIYPKQFLKEK